MHASNRHAVLTAFLIVGLGALVGCNAIVAVVDSDGVDQPGPDIIDAPDGQPGGALVPDDAAMPDFAVVDVNADSPRFEEAVSPRDYLGQISAWYFGAAT
jgi:hypothetical protein